MEYDVAITNGTVVTADERFAATVGIDDGRIVALLDAGREPEADELIDADGRCLLPGGVDPHVHMMDPGQTHREDFPTGTAAAAAGGITTVGEHHRTDPMVLWADVLAEKRSYLSDRARVDFGLLAGGHPDNIGEFEALQEAGTLAFKSFTCEVHGVPAVQSDAMLEIYREIERVGGISMVHPEDELLLQRAKERLQSSGSTDWEALHGWRSAEAEQVATAMTLQIAEATGTPLWFAHLSQPGLVEQVQAARARGVDAYAETCPQYLYLTADDIVANAPLVTFTPPPRDETARVGLWEKLASGDIHMVNADHAPNTREAKAESTGPFDVPFGIPGVETVLPLLLNGAAEGRITLERVAEVFATNPAKITGLYPRKGEIRVGADADIVIVDPDETWTITDDDIVAKCGWTPYDGDSVTGAVDRTLVRGETVFTDGDVVGEPGYGQFLRPGDRAPL